MPSLPRLGSDLVWAGGQAAVWQRRSHCKGEVLCHIMATTVELFTSKFVQQVRMYYRSGTGRLCGVSAAKTLCVHGFWITSRFHDDTLCRKVLASDEWTRSVRLAPAAPVLCCICSSVLQLTGSNYDYSSWSVVHSYLFNLPIFMELVNILE